MHIYNQKEAGLLCFCLTSEVDLACYPFLLWFLCIAISNCRFCIVALLFSSLLVQLSFWCCCCCYILLSLRCCFYVLLTSFLFFFPFTRTFLQPVRFPVDGEHKSTVRIAEQVSLVFIVFMN